MNLLLLEVIPSVGCCCNLPFNIDNALTILNQTNRTSNNAAQSRLTLYATRLCMNCNKDVCEGEEESYEVPKTSDSFFRFRIIPPETESKRLKIVTLSDHVMCFKCADKMIKIEKDQKAKLKDTGANIQISVRHKVLNCKICDDDHFIDIRDWNEVYKRNCCSQCLIY